MPKVSVILPTYNRPEYLPIAIESVLSQELHSYELIVLNDGGQDVGSIIDSFDAPHIINYHHGTINRGKAYRCNQGLQLAKGEYIAYIDDDDLWYPHHLKSLSNALDHSDAVLAYSDLYAVPCLLDERTKIRVPLDKHLQISRMFTRQFLFYYNHVLHVSLMHRRKEFLDTGGFNENVKVIIEWVLTRKLAFSHDFIYVPTVTGEYYMPINRNSDRISVIQRRDRTKYNDNKRLIKTSNPPEPWKHVKKVGIIFTVSNWSENACQKMNEVYDDIFYPSEFYLISNGAVDSKTEIRKKLGSMGIMPNVHIIRSSEKLPDYLPYELAIGRSTADYFLLGTNQYQSGKVKGRVLLGIEALEKYGGNIIIKWGVPEEMEFSSYDSFASRETWESVFSSIRNNYQCYATSKVIDQQSPPSGFIFDGMFGLMKLYEKKGLFAKAYQVLRSIDKLKKERPPLQFIVSHIFRLCMAMKMYEEAEVVVNNCYQIGYIPDNALRLGQLYQMKEDYEKAIHYYQQYLVCLGIHDRHFDLACFPSGIPQAYGLYQCLSCLAECFFSMEKYQDAAKYLKFAGLTFDNGHVYTMFGRLFWGLGDIDSAVKAVDLALEKGDRPRALLDLYEKIYWKKEELS